MFVQSFIFCDDYADENLVSPNSRRETSAMRSLLVGSNFVHGEANSWRITTMQSDCESSILNTYTTLAGVRMRNKTM